MFRKSKSAICILLGVTLLAGCGTENTTTQQTSATNNENSEKVTLNLWHYYNGATNDALIDIISEFNETEGEKKNILVQARSYSSVSELATALVSSANKEVGVDDMPDIFSAYSDTALLLNDMGMVATLDGYFTNEELSLFQQDFLNEGRFDAEGGLKIIPVAKSTEILFINETDFNVFAQETGSDISQMETWEDMAKLAETYYNWTDAKTPEENDGSAFFGVDSEANFMLVASKQMGEEIYTYNDDGSVSFGLSQSSAEKIWDTLIVPYIKGYYTAFGSYRSDDIKSGDLLAYSGSTSSVYYFPTTVELGRSEAYDIVGTAMPYPYFEDGEKIAVQQGAGMVVSKTDAVRESASVEFLKWFTSAEYNLDFAVSTGYIPVQNEALSFDSVLEVMQENSNGEISNIVLDSANITYNEVMKEYQFYSNKPFEGSYDTRNVIKDSVINIIDYSNEYKEGRLAEGGSYEEIIETLTNKQAFEYWYLDLETAITEILEAN